MVRSPGLTTPDRNEQATELRQAGSVRNNADLVGQAISALYQRIVKERLKILRLKTLEKTGEYEFEAL